MKVKSNLKCNSSVIVGKGKWVTIPAGAVLELADENWKEVQTKLQPMLDSGGISILEPVKKTEEELKAEEEKALADAEALIKKSKKKKTSTGSK